MTEQTHFDPRLEGTRGVAILIVALHIGLGVFSGSPIGYEIVISRIIDWLLAITSPTAAITFSFVLSGYVLGNSVVRLRNFFVHAARRALRLLPMFVVSVLLAFFCMKYARVAEQPTDLNTFFSKIVLSAPTVEQLLGNLMMWSARINPLSWPVQPELIGSIFMLPLVNLHRSLPVLNSWIVVLILSTILAFTGFRVVVWFYCGFFLVPWFAALISQFKFGPIVAFAGGYAALQYTALGFDFTYSFRFIVPTSIGASLIIAAIVSNAAFLTPLECPALRWIGRTSYSFLLLYWPLLYLTWVGYMQTSFPHGTTGNLVICSVSIALTLATSYGTYRVIEYPLIRLGRRLLDGEQAKRHKGDPHLTITG
jgi:peptidoglycan/LPS O-acetylase OafA/YrhL